MLTAENHMESPSENENRTEEWYQILKQAKRSSLIFMAAVVIIFTLYSFFSSGTGTITCEVNDELLGVAGFNGTSIFIPLDDISTVQLLDTLSPGILLEGTESDEGWCGTFSNELYAQYTLYATTRSDLYVEVIYTDGIFIFNTGTSSQTQSVYNSIMQHLQERQEK